MSTSGTGPAIDPGQVHATVAQGIATVTFGHPRSNSLPGALLTRLADTITSVGNDPDARVLILRSEGPGAFCGGASFDELKVISSLEEGRRFFSGFAKVILAMIRCPKFV